MNLDIKIGVIGLGYVGLPLARLFATKHLVLGFDINTDRITDLQHGLDQTQEISEQQLNEVLIDDFEQTNVSNGLVVTTDKEKLSQCNYYIITVPTPVDKNNKPNLTPLYQSSETVASYLKKGDIVVYESTVYPGLTEEECVPVLERVSNLKYNVDFFVGYSPERINPGDKLHTVDKMMKITSGSTPETAQKVNELYLSVITAGTYLAPSIKVAEAAKVIENSQRDINIAFVNELAKIFSLMKIDTQEVLAAAATKWNFLPFKPGLVGGHCIGVDPYYLAQKAQELGYHPEIILAGRRLNDSMGEYVASQVVKLMIKNGVIINKASLLVLGITFKENCPDVRNTKIVDLVRSLMDYGIKITIYDPLVSPETVFKEYQLESIQELPKQQYDAIVLGVAHKEFLNLDLKQYQTSNAIVYDVKGVLGNIANGRL